MAIARQLSTVAVEALRSNFVPNYPSQLAWTALRVVVGLMMIHNGLDKLADIESFAQAYLIPLGFPFPVVLSYLAAYAELVGAPLLAIGLLARPAALTLFGTMAVAIYHHITVAGFNIPYLELTSIYAAAFLFFAVNGPGLFSVDSLLAGWLNAILRDGQERDRAAVSSEAAAKTPVESR